jgi:secondary thiamine-phosphate synthase enzyme
LALAQEIIAVRTTGQGLHEVTREIALWVAGREIRRGLLTIFIRHTSASLVIQENAAPEVRGDLERFMERLVPEDPALYAHDDEGPDDMPSHIRSALTQTHLAIPVDDGTLLLGTWQGIYVFEHRRRPHRRELVLHLAGES